MNDVLSDTTVKLNNIHDSAIIHPSVKLGKNISIGPWTRIGPNVTIGDNTSVADHVVIDKNTVIGQNNKFYAFSSIGIDPQDRFNREEDFVLEIGDCNTIREYVTISRGTSYGGEITKIGNNNLIMAYSHIAHDCILGNNIIMSNNATLAGHVIVEDYASMSGFAGVHQFCRIGAHSFLGMRCTVSQDVAPYMLIAGAEPSVRGINIIGLKRRGFTDETISILRNAYKKIYRSGGIIKTICDELEQEYKNNSEIKILVEFIKKAERGLLR
jgi:UDP-N-acetylglucosamine acyltransferase